MGTDSDTIGERLWTLRAEHDMTQAALAEDMGIGQNTISSLEKGKRTPSTSIVVLYAEYFGVSTDWILLGRDHEI